jgi:hypothetical protein
MSKYTVTISGIETANTNPSTGTVIAYFGNIDPDGWVIADGVSRTYSNKYTNLINMGIGEQNASKYTPPNFNGAFLRGIGTSDNGYAGPTELAIKNTVPNSYQNSSYKKHNHTVNSKEHTHTRTGEFYTPFDFQGDWWSSHSDWSKSKNVFRTFTQSTYYSGNSEISMEVNDYVESQDQTCPYNVGVKWIIKL